MSLVGWRAFTVSEDGLLVGPASHVVWFPGINDAYCIDHSHRPFLTVRVVRCPLVDTEHQVPTEQSRCGFYATKRPHDVDLLDIRATRARTVLGVVELAGHIVAHQSGWRAGQARVIAIGGGSVSRVDPRYRVDRHSELATLVARWWDGEPYDTGGRGEGPSAAGAAADRLSAALQQAGDSVSAAMRDLSGVLVNSATEQARRLMERWEQSNRSGDESGPQEP